MRKIILFLRASFICLFIFSCRKDPLNSKSGAIKASINGSGKTFDNSVRASLKNLNAGSPYFLDIYGNLSSGDSHPEEIKLEVRSLNPITTATYSALSITNGSPGVAINYSIYNFLTPGYIEFNSDYMTTNNNATITLNAISSSSVQGTFKGDVAAGGSIIHIEGEFKVNF